MNPKIEQLIICLNGFKNSSPKDEKTLKFKERMIREIESELKTLGIETIENKAIDS